MADVVSPSTNAVETTTKKSKKTEKVTRPKASHPPTAIMVTNAIKNLKERGGSSLQAIKKYVSSTYKVDAEKLAPYIKKYIKASVTSGSLVQTKGKGASGSFKLSSGTTNKTPSASSVTKVVKKPATKKTSKPRTKSVEKPATPKKSPAKKAIKPKRASVAEKKAVVAPKTKAVYIWSATKPKSPAKAKKVTKAPTKKPKSPKTKTTKPKAAAAKPTRKAASKKK